MTFKQDWDFINRMNKQLDENAARQKTLSDLIEVGELRLHGDVLTADKGITLETIYGNDATVTICRARLKGGRVADHIHEGVSQYLICVKGKFDICLSNIPGNHRVLTPTNCFAVPPSELHSVTALENDSELIAVCVPEDAVYKKTMDNK